MAKSDFEYEVENQKRKNQEAAKKGRKIQAYNLVKDYSDRQNKPPKGKQYGTCKECGKQFEQEFSDNRNSYSSHRICQDCRKLKSVIKQKEIDDAGGVKKVYSASMQYKPHPWQIEAEEAFKKHRFIVLACGNRAGKDRFSIMAGIEYFIECLNENRAVHRPDMVPPVYWWQIAPTDKMARQNWRELKQFFPKEWVVSISDSSYQMETIGGGVVEVRSGYSPEDLVGVGVDIVTITEGARFRDLSTAWANVEARLNSPGRGLEKDRIGHKYGQGKAIINSSPIGKNEFYDLFLRGQKSSDTYSSEWWSAQYPWTCNPDNLELAQKPVQTRNGVITYEESLRRQLGERVFRSNYLADFLSEDGTVFKDFEEHCVINVYSQCKTEKEREEYIRRWKEPIPGEEYVGGYDPATGSSGDSPAFIIRQKSTGNVVYIRDLYGMTYEQQYDYISSACKKYNYAEIHWLRTGHTAIEGEFEKRGILEVPIDENGLKKAALVQTLATAVENGDVHVLYDGTDEIRTLIYQMSDYSEKNGKFSNNKSQHDDFCSAMYAAFSDYSANEILMGYCGLMKRV